MSLLTSAIEFAHVVGIARLVARLTPFASRRWFPMIAAPMAFAATASMAVPVVPLLVSLVALRRQRWRALVFWSVMGSSLAGALLIHLVGHFGMAFMDAQLPQLGQSKHWHYLVEWAESYGFATLAVISATPFAQTPVLMLAAMFGMKWPAAGLALLLGKSVKYTIAGALAARTGERLALYDNERSAGPDLRDIKAPAHPVRRITHGS
jgi:membrane protein YqaA with SNARE-associated domain